MENELKKRNSNRNSIKESNLEMENVQDKNGTINGEVTFEELDYTPTGWLETTLASVGDSSSSFLTKHQSFIKTIIIYIINGLVIGFLIGCIYYWNAFGTGPLQLCDGVGSLIAFLTIVYAFLIYFQVIKRFFGEWLSRYIWSRIGSCWNLLWELTLFKIFFSTLVVSSVVVFLYFDTIEQRERLISLSGMLVLLIFGFTFSKHPGRIRWQTVLAGLMMQLIFGLLFIRWPAGRAALQCFSEKVATFLSYGVDGAAFVFGDLLVREQSVFAFSTLPVVFFFSMLVEILFFWGALQWFCLKLGQLLNSATGTTVCEGVIAVGNMFLGMWENSCAYTFSVPPLDLSLSVGMQMVFSQNYIESESILLIKPYLSVLTPSEIHLVMASGFATVSGTILAAYIGFGAEPAYLVTASVMSAPTAIMFSKLMMPETRRSLTTLENIKPVECADQSALSAATRGATNGISLMLNIIANLVAFVAFVAFINGVLGYCGGLLGFAELNLEWIFGKIFIPMSFVMGVPWSECEQVGTLIGLKTVVNEFVAYQRMGEMKAAGMLSPRAEIIATYALCGFTNPASAGIMIGAIAAIAPNQRETLSSMAVRAFFTACGICFMNASLAGLLMSEF